MKYKLRRHGKKWKIWETQTSQYIAAFSNLPYAQKIHKNLEAGGGFAGRTPRFLTRHRDIIYSTS
jgi:hypothetical protein